MTDNNYIIELKDVSFRYEEKNVLESINLRVPYGAFLGLVGPNGSGKSTLLKLILGLLTPRTGSIKLFGQDVRQFKQKHKIGFVSQKANSFNSGFPATVYEVVQMGLAAQLGMFRFYKKSHKQIIEKAIDAVGMKDFMHRNIGELSGGQQQRTFIARALVSSPELLILDEPTVGVDAAHVQSFYEMLKHLNEKGITLILVSHDVGTMTDKATDVACLNKTLHFHGGAEEFDRLKDSELSNFYGHGLQRLNHDHETKGGEGRD